MMKMIMNMKILIVMTMTIYMIKFTEIIYVYKLPTRKKITNEKILIARMKVKKLIITKLIKKKLFIKVHYKI